MKLTFIIPPVLCGKREVERVFGCTYGLYPIPNIFFLYAATIFLNKSHQVPYLDMSVLGWSKNNFLNFVSKDQSQAYLFYSVNLAKDTDLKAVKYIKEKHPESWIIFMGPAPTFCPEDFLLFNRTIIIKGEIEETALELADFFINMPQNYAEALSKINGISFLDSGVIKHNVNRKPITDIDKLFFPARQLVNKNKYYNPKLGVTPFTALLTSRGCFYQCRYCVPNSQSFARELAFRQESKDYRKPAVSIRSFENVYQEIELIKSQGYKAISIIDDQFISDGKREIKIAQALGKFGFAWGCLSRADRITEDIAKAFSQNNCRYVDVGVESFSQEILDDIHKGTIVEKMYNGIKILKKYSVPVKLNILFGASIKENINSIRQTMKIVRSLHADSIMVGICNPFPGTEFWDIAVKNGWLLYDRYKPVDVQKEATISYRHLDFKTLEQEVKKANLAFFFRLNFVIKNYKRLLNPRTLIKDIKILVKKLTKP